MNVESVGKTVEEALEAALKELNLKKEEVDYTILVEPKKGFLGFGKKEAKILVTPKADTISVKAEDKGYSPAAETFKDKVVTFGERQLNLPELFCVKLERKPTSWMKDRKLLITG